MKTCSRYKINFYCGTQQTIRPIDVLNKIEKGKQQGLFYFLTEAYYAKAAVIENNNEIHDWKEQTKIGKCTHSQSQTKEDHEVTRWLFLFCLLGTYLEINMCLLGANVLLKEKKVWIKFKQPGSNFLGHFI